MDYLDLHLSYSSPAIQPLVSFFRRFFAATASQSSCRLYIDAHLVTISYYANSDWLAIISTDALIIRSNIWQINYSPYMLVLMQQTPSRLSFILTLYWISKDSWLHGLHANYLISFYVTSEYSIDTWSWNDPVMKKQRKLHFQAFQMCANKNKILLIS